MVRRGTDGPARPPDEVSLPTTGFVTLSLARSPSQGAFMRPAPRRVLPVIAAVSLATALSACSSDDSASDSRSDAPSSSARPTLTGCDGPAAPKFTGTTQAYDSVAKVDQDESVGVQTSEPTLTKVSSGARGWAVAQLKVHASVLTNGVFAVSPDSFVLVDPQGKQCTRPRTSALPSPLAVSEIDERKSVTGTVGFLVPDDADLSEYSVVYVGDPSSRTAAAKWSSEGTAPKSVSATTCSNKPSPMGLEDGVERTSFGGERDTIGDPRTGAVRVAVSHPRPKTLEPSDRHPNNVDGLEVTVKVEAVGSVAFVERNMFQMVDGKNNLCGYSQLGTEGENLSSDLVPAGQTRTYTLIFWAPKGSASDLKDLQVIYRSRATSNTGDAAFYNKNENPPYPKPAPKPRPSGSSSAPSSSAPSGSSSPAPSTGSGTPAPSPSS